MKKLYKHEMRCNNCRQIIDLRDLSQVFAHENCNGTPIDYENIEEIPHLGAKKISEPTLYTMICGDVGLN